MVYNYTNQRQSIESEMRMFARYARWDSVPTRGTVQCAAWSSDPLPRESERYQATPVAPVRARFNLSAVRSSTRKDI